MKLTHKVLSAVLLAGIGAAVVLPSATKAAPDSKASKGDIEFTKNTTDTGVLPPTDSSDTETFTDLPSFSVDSFGIRAITPLDFDKHDATLGASAAGYWALPYSEAGRTKEVEHFVLFKDDRAQADHTWKLEAEMSDFEAMLDDGNTGVLKGAKITYSNMNLGSEVNPAVQPTAPVLGDGTGTATIEAASTGKVQMALNDDSAKEGKGKGEYYLTFGDNDKGTEGESVKLDIDAGANIANKKYTSVITWTLSETK